MPYNKCIDCNQGDGKNANWFNNKWEHAQQQCASPRHLWWVFSLSWVCMKFQRHISWVVNKTQFKWRKTVFKEKFPFNNISQEDFAVAQLLLVICEIVCCNVKLHKKGKDQRTNIELMTIWTENSHRFEKCHLLAMFCSKMWHSQHHSAPKKKSGRRRNKHSGACCWVSVSFIPTSVFIFD